MFTEYSIFLSSKRINGSLAKALKENSEADKNNVPLKVRKEIEEALRSHFLLNHSDYKETEIQLTFNFEDEQ